MSVTPVKECFEKEIFHERYHRNRSLINVFLHEEDDENVDNPEDEASDEGLGEVVEHVDETEHLKPLDDRQKFKIIMPIIMGIANIASLHGTKQFWKYKTDLEIVEKKIRSGA